MLTKGLLVLVVPLITLSGAATAIVVLQRNETQVRQVAIAANLLSTSANQVLVDALNAETAVRGYALTKDPTFLAPYDLARTRIGAERVALRNAAVANGDVSGQRLTDLAAGTAFTDIELLRSAIDNHASAAQVTGLLTAGRAAMDLLRSRTAQLVAGPTNLAHRNSSSITTLQTVITRLNIVGLALGILAGLAGIALFTSGISRRVVAAAANADRLGRGEPLRPVIDSDDDLGRLARSLVQAEQLLSNRAAQLVTARDEALHATQAKNAFLSNTSHELRTPLNSILGFAQLLEMSDLHGDDADSVQRILHGGHHLLALINELIDTARIESGELTLSVEPVSVLPLIQQTSHLLAPLAAERSITITRRGGRPALAVRADRQRLSQIFVNLISNAIKYNRRGGNITVTCEEEHTAERVDIVISDTGPGLTPQDLQLIFVPFERLGAEQTGIEGTGIGLSLAKALAEAMGGQLTATSVVGEGSSFTVSLHRAPDIDQPTTVVTPTARSTSDANTSGMISVLYIEDNPANIEVVARLLKTRTNTVLRSAASGRAGIECAIQDVPDIILLDLHLPDLPGDQVLDEFRSMPQLSAVPVVVLSAEANPSVIRRLRRYGILAYLTKPIDLAKLSALLDSVASPADTDTATPGTVHPNSVTIGERQLP